MKDCKQLAQVMIGIASGYFASRGGGRRKKSRIGHKGKEHTVVVGLISHIRNADEVTQRGSEVKRWIVFPTSFCVVYRLIK